MEFMKMMKSRGLSIEPCGTPGVIGESRDETPPTTTLCCLPVRYSSNQESRGSEMPTDERDRRIRVWGTESNTFFNIKKRLQQSDDVLIAGASHLSLRGEPLEWRSQI